MNAEPQPQTVHASAVLAGTRGILIRGASGSGKSALALALIDDPCMAARLVADDRVVLTGDPNGIFVRSPPEIAGMIEVRGIGIVRMPFAAEAPVRLVVDLLPLESCPRMPDEDERTVRILDCDLPRLALPVGAADGVLRVRLALEAWTVDG